MIGPLSPNEERYVLTWHDKAPIEVIAESIGISPLRAIQILRERGALVDPLATERSWTPEEDAFLRKEYPAMGVVWVLRRLGRSYESVSMRARRLGVRFSGKT